MEVRMIYITCKDREEAGRIAEVLVGERLAACGNIIDGMESIYWWEGKLTRDKEAILILKTTASQVEALTRRAKEVHSYEVPCVVEIPINGGNTDYLNWVREETKA